MTDISAINPDAFPQKPAKREPNLKLGLLIAKHGVGWVAANLGLSQSTLRGYMSSDDVPTSTDLAARYLLAERPAVPQTFMLISGLSTANLDTIEVLVRAYSGTCTRVEV